LSKVGLENVFNVVGKQTFLPQKTTSVLPVGHGNALLSPMQG
jgi:hypothetical protein